MNNKLLMVGSVVLLILLGLLGVQLGNRNAEVNPSVSQAERYPFQSLSLQEIASFSIQTPLSSHQFKKVKLENTSYFGIVEKKSYPADGILINQFLNSLVNTVLIRKLKSSEKLLKECGIHEDSATKISFYKEDGSLLQKLHLGKESSTGGHFLRLEKNPEQIFLTEEKIVLPEASQTWEDLRLPRLVQKHIRSIRFSFPREGLTQTYTIQRAQDDAPLKPKESEFSTEHLNSILNFLGQLNVSQLASISLAEAGLDKPVQVVEYQLSGDAQIIVSLGNVLPWKKTDTTRQRYVSLDFKINQESPEDLKSYYLDWKKRSGNHIFLLRDAQEFALLNFQAPLLGKLSSVQELLMQQKEKSISLKRNGEEWLVLNGYEFPADTEKVQNFIRELEEIKSRPGDIANPGVLADTYQEKEPGNIQYSLKMEGNLQKTLIQAKARQGEEDTKSPDQYKRLYFIDDVSETSDEWGNYFIKPSGAITLGSRAPAVDLNPEYWLHRDLGHFPKEELSSLQLQIKDQLIAWTPDEKGNWVANLPEVKSEDLLNFLKEFTISDVVKSDEKELTQQFEQQSEVLHLSLKNKDGLCVQVSIHGHDASLASLGKISASYEAPPLPPNLVEVARQEKEQSLEALKQAELVATEASGTYELAIQKAEKSREEVALETQQLTEMQQLATKARSDWEEAQKKSEPLDKPLAELEEARDRTEREVAEKTQQLQKKQETATDLSKAAESLKGKAILAQESLTQAKKNAEESAKKLEQLEQESALQKAENEEAQKARDEKAKETQQQVEKINKIFGGRLVKWDQESSRKMFVLPIKHPAYSLDLLTSVTIQAGDANLDFRQDSPGEWKRGEQYVKRDQIEALLKQFGTLDLRYGNEMAPVASPQITLTLGGAEKNNVYKISASFEVKSGEETKRYKYFQWNENTYLIVDTDFSVDLDPKNWDDLRLIRSSIKDFQSAEIECPGKSLKHLLVLKEGRLEFPDLASDHAMFDSGLEENLDHLFGMLTLNSFEDRPSETTVALNNVLTLRRTGSELVIRFSDPQQDSIYLTLAVSGTSNAQQIQTALEKKWAKIPSHLLESLSLKREEMEGLRVYVSHILVSWKGAERSRSNKTKEEARKRIEEVEQKLKEPNFDFAALAKEYSDEPAAKQSGGVIPIPLQKDTQGYDETFKATALKLEKPGSMSLIIETKFGFHILRRDQ